MRSRGGRGICPCARERPILVITGTRDKQKLGSTGDEWEGGDGVVWSNFHCGGHCCESSLESERPLLL